MSQNNNNQNNNQNDNSGQSLLSLPIITSSVIGALVFWAARQVVEKKNFENTAKILSENYERSHDAQIKELKDDIKVLQGQIEAKIDIIEQKNVHINLINKEFHNLQKNYNRLKKESMFLKDQLHNAQLDIVEFEQENVNLVNQLNEALQHINSLDQILESEKLSDQSAASKIIGDYTAPSTAGTSNENLSEIAAESTKAGIISESEDISTIPDLVKVVKNRSPKKQPKFSNNIDVYKNDFIPRDEFYRETASVAESGSHPNSEASARISKHLQYDEEPEPTPEVAKDEAPFDLDQPVEKKRVSNGIDFDEVEIKQLNEAVKDDVYSFSSNIIFDENIITNANPPSPLKYDLAAQRRGHHKTESTFSHKSYKSGKSSKSSSSKVFVNPDNGSEIMVQGPSAVKRNKSGNKTFGLFHFGGKSPSRNNHGDGFLTNAHMYDIDDDDDEFKMKWVSELENVKNHVSRSNSTKRKSYHSGSYNDEIAAEKDTVKDNSSDVLMVDYQKGVIYNKDYSNSSNLIPKLSKANKFSFKRKSGDKNTFERRVASSAL